MKDKILLSWSGGKDAALALHELQTSSQYEVVGLLTTITAEYDRISMHGVRRVLLQRQARDLGLPLGIVSISTGTTDAEYRARMREEMQRHLDAGVLHVAFGDIFLEDVRRYREENLALLNMHALFPLWDRDPGELSRSFIDEGFKAIVTCVDSKALSGSFVGRRFDESFLGDLPPTVDPCGENGEFHSFVYDGPIFRRPVPYRKGPVALRDGRFYFCDLLP